jgi:hypothetical protein
MPEEQGPDAAEAQTWIGWRLDELGGVAVGKVDGFFVDEETGRPRVARGPASALRAAGPGAGRARPSASPGASGVPYARETIKTARKADAKSPLRREAELELLKHFGAGGNAARAAELSARGFKAITASPAS